MADNVRELPDHIGPELGCMEVLCEAEARARDEGDGSGVERATALRRRLLHLLRWVPALCERIRANALGPFYRGIVALTKAFLDQEARAQDASCE